MQDWLAARRVFWIPRDFSDWPGDLNGLRLTMRGLCYEVAARDTVPDLDSPMPPASRYHINAYRDPETQDVCRRFAATACRRGIIRFANNAYAEALRDFNLALEYFPDYPSAIEDKGIVFFYSNQPDSARFYLERYITLDPRSPEIPKVKQVLAQLGK
jgi:tetratricopeptide (TPR) repeat protein